MSLRHNSSYDEVYAAAIASGSSPAFADMLASRKAPEIGGGDTAYMKGRGTLATQFEGCEQQLDYLTKTAKRKGYNPGINDIYEASLASFPGDPAAFVPPSGGLNHIKHVCEDKDISCDGAFKRKRSIKDPDNKPFIDKKIYKRLAKKMVSEDPGLAAKPRREVKEAVYDKHAFKG